MCAYICDALLRFNSLYFLTFYSPVLDASGPEKCRNAIVKG